MHTYFITLNKRIQYADPYIDHQFVFLLYYLLPFQLRQVVPIHGQPHFNGFYFYIDQHILISDKAIAMRFSQNKD